MFAKESEMTASAIDWLSGEGLVVKAEFQSPWGLCDLVGLSYRPEQVAKRLAHRQLRPIASLARAALLAKIPDSDSACSTTIEDLDRDFRGGFTRQAIETATDRLIADRFVARTGDGRLHRLNGWLPLHGRLIALELKLTRVAEAFEQAISNLGFTEESYVGLPADLAMRVAEQPTKWARYLDEGVGLMGLEASACRVIIPARLTARWLDPVLQMYCVDKFWRQRPSSTRS
jgi:hypothetical protein